MSKSDQTRPQSTNSLLYSPIYFRTPPLDSCYDVTGKLALISLIHVALELHQLICFSAVVSLLGGYHTSVSVYYHTISGTSLKLIVNKSSKTYAGASNTNVAFVLRSATIDKKFVTWYMTFREFERYQVSICKYKYQRKLFFFSIVVLKIRPSLKLIIYKNTLMVFNHCFLWQSKFQIKKTRLSIYLFIRMSWMWNKAYLKFF